MGKLYTINPFINSDYIPRKSTVAGVISDHFYLFNVYSKNPYNVRAYMEFIDSNFNFAFQELGYQIIYYEYPDRLEDDSDIIEYINERYELMRDYQLDACYQLNIRTITDMTTGKEGYVYFNDYVYYDIGLLGASIISDVDNDVLPSLLDELKYLSNRKTIHILSEVIYQIMEYQSQLDYISNGGIEYFESDLISVPMFVLCQLKSYINQLVDERGD